MIEAAAAAALVTGLVLIDALCIPRSTARALPRSLAGTAVLLGVGGTMFGMLLVLTGSLVTSAAVTLLLATILTLISNVKYAVLGEPLVFSDFALVAAVFQQPQFYLSALKRWHMVLMAAVALALVGALASFSNLQLSPRLAGAGLALAGCGLLAALARLAVWHLVAQAPDLARDVSRHGLVATLFAYWFHWRRIDDPALCNLPVVSADDDPLVVIVQCESFSDPAELFGDLPIILPGLAAARAVASQAGCLKVPGFGAYTMRTEYGVLFGRSEEQLGLRRFDPFLTAHGEVSWALPNRLRRDQWISIFLHPHDLRFYGRDRLMPEAGFDRVIGAEGFPVPSAGEGRYVTDAAVCDAILDIAGKAGGATFIYTVTIENHGPWPVQDKALDGGNGAAYLRLLRRSDAMLLRLIEELPRLGRPVTLCFFGDHRPSIPEVSEPAGNRHTPYLIVGFKSDGTPVASQASGGDLTPADLHHAVIAAINSRRGK